MAPDPLITYRRKPVSLDLSGLEAFAWVLRRRVTRGHEYHCRITNDIEMAALNQRFRRKKGATDVLSFSSGAAEPLGDVAISLGRARLQAREWGHSTEDEIRILLLHGVLHLMGYDHETDEGRMQRAEQRWRKKLGLPTSLIARTSAAVKVDSCS